MEWLELRVVYCWGGSLVMWCRGQSSDRSRGCCGVVRVESGVEVRVQTALEAIVEWLELRVVYCWGGSLVAAANVVYSCGT